MFICRRGICTLIKEKPCQMTPRIGGVFLRYNSYVIYKDGEENYYETWCVTPLSWGTLRALVRTVIDRLGLDNKSCGAYIRQ